MTDLSDRDWIIPQGTPVWLDTTRHLRVVGAAGTGTKGRFLTALECGTYVLEGDVLRREDGYEIRLAREPEVQHRTTSPRPPGRGKSGGGDGAPSGGPGAAGVDAEGGGGFSPDQAELELLEWARGLRRTCQDAERRFTEGMRLIANACRAGLITTSIKPPPAGSFRDLGERLAAVQRDLRETTMERRRRRAWRAWLIIVHVAAAFFAAAHFTT